MRRLGPVLAIAFVLLVAAVMLVNVARNRAGEPTADVVLTERELPLLGSLPEENSGLMLHIAWSPGDTLWFDRAKLESLGFDCSYAAGDSLAAEHYQGVPGREVALVLEFDGAATARRLAAQQLELESRLREIAKVTDSAAREERSAGVRVEMERAKLAETRLTVLDAGRDPGALRRQYPDRSRYIVARGIVRVFVEPARAETPTSPVSAARIRGAVSRLSVEDVHVARGQRALLDSLMAGDRKAAAFARPQPGKTPAVRRANAPHPPRYRVRVRYGRRLEPWIVSVEPALP